MYKLYVQSVIPYYVFNGVDCVHNLKQARHTTTEYYGEIIAILLSGGFHFLTPEKRGINSKGLL